jgi:hypothetical protein
MGKIMLSWISAERKEDGYSMMLRRARIFLRNDVLSSGRSLARIRIRLRIGIRIRSRMGIDWMLRSTTY